MALADDLIAKGRDIILGLQTVTGAQQEVREQFLNLLALNPAGLTYFQIAAAHIQAYAEVVEVHRQELRPWVTVYAAAMGIEWPWSAILTLWSRQDLPSDLATIDPTVDELIASLFTGYANLVAV